MLVETTVHNLAGSASRLAKIQAQLTSQRRIVRPSDDPAAAVRAIRYDSDLAATRQFRRNADAAKAWLGVTDVAFGTATDLLQRAHELAVQGATDTLSSDDRQAIEREIQAIRSQLIDVGNTTLGSEYVFAGQQTTRPAFTDAGLYQGDGGEVKRQVGLGTTVTVNVPGDVALGSALAAVQGLADALVADDRAAVAASIDTLKQQISNVTAVRGMAGNRLRLVETADDRLAALANEQLALLSKEVDLDLAEAAVSYAEADMVHRAALAAGARAIPPSLMDFLR
jgi:flagellar hook-associated protein 3 FlgL